jgi:hypothetical protein
MKRAATSLLLLALCATTLGCFRTRYYNFTPYGSKSGAILMRREATNPASWQSFFVYGWSPAELVIDAGKACGGASYVESIETRQTFVQGLIAAVAGYYINIYSPYTGAVSCQGVRIRR